MSYLTFCSKEDHAKYYLNLAKTRWFKDHQVIVRLNTPEATIVTFAKPGSIEYALRFIYSGHHVYVSGDLGCAVFNCTWTTKPTDKYYNDLWYIHSKLAACEDDRMVFDDTVCEAQIKNTLLEQDENGNMIMPERWGSEERKTYLALINASREQYNKEAWCRAVEEIDRDGSVSALDSDYWEWLYKAGNVMPPRIVGIIAGLQIVSETLQK